LVTRNEHLKQPFLSSSTYKFTYKYKYCFFQPQNFFSFLYPTVQKHLATFTLFLRMLGMITILLKLLAVFSFRLCDRLLGGSEVLVGRLAIREATAEVVRLGCRNSVCRNRVMYNATPRRKARDPACRRSTHYSLTVCGGGVHVGARRNTQVSAVRYNSAYGNGRQYQHGAVNSRQVRHHQTWRRQPCAGRARVQSTHTWHSRHTRMYMLTLASSLDRVDSLLAD